MLRFPWWMQFLHLKFLISRPGRQAATLIGLNYLQAAISFAVGLWLAKRLGEVNYGIVGSGYALVAITTTFVDFGAERTLVRDLAHSLNSHVTLTASVAMRCALALVCAAIGAVILAATRPANATIMVLFFLSGLVLGVSPRGWLDYRGRMVAHSLIVFAERVIFSFVVVWCVNCNSSALSVLCVAVCGLASRCASIAVQWWYTSASFVPTWSSIGDRLRWLFIQNWIVAAATIGNLAAPHLNGLVLAYKRGPAEMSHYFLAFQISAAVGILQKVVVRILVPRIAQATRPGSDPAVLVARFRRYILLSTMVTAGMTVTILVIAETAVLTFLPIGFADAIWPLRLLLATCVVDGIAFVVNHFLLCLRQDASYFATCIVKGVAAILLGLALIPYLGANGVAATALICTSLTLVVQLVLCSRVIHQWRG